METNDVDLEREYFDLNNAYAYGSEWNLKNDYNKTCSPKIRKHFLSKQGCYTKHVPACRPTTTDLVFASNVDDWWHMDLADMRSLKSENDGASYILVAIDVLSKYGFARVIKNKSAINVKNALIDIFEKERRKPDKIYVDCGSEFNNTLVKGLLKKENIEIYFAKGVSSHKACIAERWIRTLKTRLWRYFSHNNTHRYIDVLGKVVKGYNNSKHSSINCAPSSVNASNFLSVWKKLYCGKFIIKNVKARLKEGEYVRISKLKKHFAKGYENNFTDEIFQIKAVIHKNPVMYELIDLTGEDISGRFYERELVNVTLPEYFEVNKILRTRKKGNRREFLVSWKGYGDKFNSWVNEIDLAKD